MSTPSSTRCPRCGREIAHAGAGCPACAPTLGAPAGAPVRDAFPPVVAGRYVARAPLGRGASKAVYLARDARLDRDVALSLVTDDGMARVEREARVMARLGEHPNVVTIHDAGEDGGVPFLVARYMAGGSLAERLASAPDGRLPLPAAVRSAREVAAALGHAHAHGVVHRDVKPDNVWLAGDGSAGLGDFGVARSDGAPALTAPGALVGTVLYMAPEQARGEPADARSDLYSLGATLYELLTGRPPFRDGDAAAVLEAHLDEDPMPPSRLAVDLPRALEELVLALLAKAPQDRPASAEAVVAALAAIEAGGGGVPRRAVTPTRRLVGRGPQLDALQGSLQEARAGRGRLVALAGEAGIGKTRIAEELAAWARTRGTTVLWGRCVEEEGAPAYLPWTQILRELATSVPPVELPDEAGELLPGAAGSAPAISPEEARFRRFEAISRLLADVAGALPLVVILDDLHWADHSSLELLVHVVRDVSRTRLLLVGTYRDGEARRRPAFADALARLVREPAFERVELGGLSEDEVARLVELAAGCRPSDALVAAIHDQTAGNPFFVGEVVRALADDGRLDAAPETAPATIPGGVRAVVAQRLRRLSAPAVAALQAASVLGRVVRLEVLAGTLGAARGATLEALQEAAEAQLMLEDPASPGRFRFAHAIVRDVVYAELAPARRARLHGAAAATLEARTRAGAEHDRGELAHHFLQAAYGGGPAEPALAHSRHAAQRALELLAYAEAADHLERALAALDLLDAPDAAERCALLLELADARTRAFQSDDGRAHYARAAEIARELGSPELFVRAALGFAEWAQYGEVDRPAIALLEEALERLPEDDGPLRAAALGRLAIRLDPAADQPRREALLAEAIAMARRLGDQDVLARLLALSPLLHWRPESVEVRRRAAAETIALADAGGDPEGALWAHIIRFVDLFGLGAIQDADAVLAAYAARAAALRQPYYRWYLMVLRAARALFAGRLDEGERLATEAVTLNRRYEPDGEQEFAVQAYVLARMRGDRLGEADVATLRGLIDRYAGLPLWEALGAHVAWALGREDEARGRLEACVSEAGVRLARDADWIGTLTLLAEVCASVGDRQRAAVLAAALSPYAERNAIIERAWAALGAVARRVGELEAMCGDMEAASAQFERALQLERRWEAWPWLVHTLRAYAAAMPEGAASAHREEADALARRLGIR